MELKISDIFQDKKIRNTIPNSSGIYIVKKPSEMEIKIKKEPDGWACELDNIYNEVQDRWKRICANKADDNILYYGRAKNLRRRIKQYVYFGYGYKNYKNHKGGRAIWYIENNKNLMFEYYEADDFESEETRLISEYEKKYGCKPLANAINGKSISR